MYILLIFMRLLALDLYENAKGGEKDMRIIIRLEPPKSLFGSVFRLIKRDDGKFDGDVNNEVVQKFLGDMENAQVFRMEPGCKLIANIIDAEKGLDFELSFISENMKGVAAFTHAQPTAGKPAMLRMISTEGTPDELTVQLEGKAKGLFMREGAEFLELAWHPEAGKEEMLMLVDFTGEDVHEAKGDAAESGAD